ncbi:MAG: hypothetical protein AB7G28_04055 [Pirellulales bacterium]
MASPFQAFRKYQKTLLAVAGVVLMFVFVLGQPLSQYLHSRSAEQGGAGRSPTATAVKWDGGKLTNAELGQLVVQRLVVNNFLRTVEAVGIQAAQESGAEPQPLRVAQMLGVERPQEGVEQDVLRTYLMADAARKAGMAISDDYIVNYLMQLGRGFVSTDTIRQILNQMHVGGRQASIDFVFDALRQEMLARNFLASYAFALQTELPEDRWRDWLRVNDRVTLEAVAVPAKSLLVDVKEPTDAELLTFFNEYKEREPMPDLNWGVELPSPDPAFRVPQRVAVQYLMADYNQFLAKAEDEVTDAEIEKFYADNKETMFQSAGSLLGDAGDLTGATDKKDETKAEETKPSETKDASSEAPAKDDTKSGDESKTEPAPNDGSNQLQASPFRLVAFQDETPSTPAGGDATAPAAEAGAAAATDSASPDAVSSAPTTEAKTYQPLDEVRDEIRRLIAETKVTQQLTDLMSALETRLNESYTSYFGASLDAEDAGKEPPPVPVELTDLTALAKENDLVYTKTDPATWQELRDTPVGVSRRQEWGNMPFFRAIMSKDYELYEPVLTQDLDANRFVAMKTSDTPGKIPTLAEVRQQVIDAWKLREAGKLALKKAEELAKAANDKGGSITDAIAGESNLAVTEIDPFAYFTVGVVSPEQQVLSFRLSQPDGIDAAGPDFMNKVFDLKDAEVGAAPNHDHSVVYVVKITGHEKSPEELQQNFLADDYNWYGVPAMTRGHQQTALGVLISDMIKSANVDWVRPADQVIQQTEEKTDKEPSES